MVTAELAAVLPAVVLVLAVALAGLGLLVDQIRCEDAARVAARAASRGDPEEQVRQVAARLAPQGAVVRITDAGDGGSVEVSVTASPGGIGSWLPATVRPGATVVTEREQAGGGP